MSKRLMILIILLACTHSLTAFCADQQMCVTFDDLPVVRSSGLQDARDITTKLLQTITQEKIPATAFVNEKKLEVNGIADPKMIALLEMWLDAGLDLGNHTYSHMDLHNNPVNAYEEDILRGESIIRNLLKEKGKQLQYFRHPYLHTGTDLETRQKVLDFLSAHGYTVAPVSIDNAEWIFALAYEKARAEDQQKIVDSYLSYMSDKIAFFEKESRLLTGRNIRHILLLHANRLNADHFSKLVKVIRAKNYEFISLSEALQDEAYRLPDKFTGRGGISWLHRWAITRGEKKDFFQGEPMAPPFVMQTAGVTEE